MAAWLTSISGAEPSAIRVAIEMPHGLIVETLLEHGVNVYAINPKQLDRFRDRFSPAAAKDDSRDAELLAGQALRGQLHARGDSNLYPRIHSHLTVELGAAPSMPALTLELAKRAHAVALNVVERSTSPDPRAGPGGRAHHCRADRH